MTATMTSTAVMTSTAKYEASRAAVARLCCRRAEISAMLRFAGMLQPAPGGITIEADLADAVSATRLKASIAAAFGYEAELLVLPRNGCGSSRYLVRVSDGRAGRNLAHQTGLIGADGRRVSGLPPQVVSGAACDCEAAWRGAFLAGGSLIQMGRCMALEITGAEFAAALALAGAARRLHIPARTRDVRGVDRVVIRDSEAVAAMLTRIGAPEAAIASQARRLPSARHQAMSHNTANMDGANQRRCEEAAEAAAARAEQALEVLGQDAPADLAAAGRLRIEHRRITLAELGQLADPPLSKDSIAGRIRRLLARADGHAAAAGIPDTQAWEMRRT